MSSIAQNFLRTAECGHTYLGPKVGRSRATGDCACHRGSAPSRNPRYSEAQGSRWAAAKDESCRWCAAVLPLDHTSSYCSNSCRYKASYARRKDSIYERRRAERASELARVAKDCPQCGESFTPENTVRQRFCSRLCTVAYYRDSSVKRCSVEGCDRPFRARGMCSMHWRRWARETGREKTPEWDDRRRANHHKRRALKKKLPSADIRPRDIYERDSWACGLCGEGIDPDVAWPDPLSASLDHILPLSKGGHHVPENVQAAHLSCNVRKGNRVEADAMSV